MKRSIQMTTLLVIFTSVAARGQLTAQAAAAGMSRGINIGNSLDAHPTETAWGNPPVQEYYFSELKRAGFDAVRIPITWDDHVSEMPPYTIESTFMNRVDTVVKWGLENGLFVIIDAHHETWLKTALSDTAKNVAHEDSCIARFDSIWSQIAAHFKNNSDSLIFEILNEPYPMSDSNTNALNARVLKIIRRTNPTRIVSYSGYRWSNSEELVTAEIPDPGSQYLIGYYHSYDPWPFGLDGGDTLTSVIYSVLKSKLDQVTSWSQNNHIPVILDEFGFIDKCAYNSRMCAYATVVDQALQHGVPVFAWDDGGQFSIFNRQTGAFGEIKDILIHTYPRSPNGMQISQLTPTSIKLQWHNRNTGSDSITIQRSVGSGGSLADYAVMAPTDSVFVDSSVAAGNAYYYRLKIISTDSTELQSYPLMLNAVATAVEPVNAPAHFELLNNYPNPFNPTTKIGFRIPDFGFVSLKVYDDLGREVAVLVNGYRWPGSHEVHFDGSRLASGVYFDRLVCGTYIVTSRMMLIK